MSGVSQFVRGKVSKSKRRYVDKANGFDLDLSYVVGKSVIAMGFPSEGLEAKYRNPYPEVIRFLEKEHGENYKVYNLCSERWYDHAKFGHRVSHLPFDDHNAPPFELIETFCADVKGLLDEDSEAVAVVHCKAGKGRTGTMICAYMLYAGLWNTTDEAMTFYAAMRTYNQKGVTIPSQIRYIRYFEHYLKLGMPPARTLLVKEVRLSGMPVSKGDLRFSIIIKTVPVLKQDVEKAKKKDKSDEGLSFLCNDVPVVGDVKMQIQDLTKGTLSEKQTLLCSLWFNTAIVSSQFKPRDPNGYKLVLQQGEIDRANKDKNHKTFPKGFFIEITFGMMSSDEAEQEQVYQRHSRELQHIPINVGGTSADDEGPALQLSSVAATYSDVLAGNPSLNNF